MKEGLDGQADSSFPLPRSLFVPYSSILPSPSYFLPSLLSLFPALCSLFVPYSFPISTQISPHFPTWIYLSVCTSVPRHPCACARMDPSRHRYAHIHLDRPLRTRMDPYVRLDAHTDASPHTIA